MHRILVALDASPRSQSVLHAAVSLARKTGAELVLFRAVGIPAEIPPEALGLPPGDVAKFLEKHALEYLEQCRTTSVSPEVKSWSAVGIGTPWSAICDAAKREACDLIMIGSHGYQGVDRLLGTTAAKVVNHAAGSVLVVRSADVVDS